MANFRTTIEVEGLRVEDAFAYLADFSTTEQWDPGVVRARHNENGPVEEGNSFDVAAGFMGRIVDLTYEIVDLRENESVTLRAENGSVVSLDTLSFASTVSGAKVTYDAELIGKGLMRWGNPVLQRLFTKIGRAAETGLEEHLTAMVPPADTTQADHGKAA